MKKIIYALLLGASLTGCVNLDSDIYDVINPNIFPQNEADAISLVTSAAYSPFRSNWYSGIFTVASGGIQIQGDMTTDVAFCQWNDAVWTDMLNVNYTPNSAGCINFYGYTRDIGKMTLTMDRIKDVTMNQSVKDRLMAELRCGKGIMGYLMYDWYGTFPVATLEELSDAMVTEITRPRPSREEMVAFIETELKESAAVLPKNYVKTHSDYGRFTGALANTVLMKLYMHEGRWADAESVGRELMKPEYGLELVSSSYKDIFTLENEGNKEIIFACQSSRSVNMALWHAHVLPSSYPTKNPNIQKWNGYRVPWSFYNQYDSEDGRLEVLIGEYQGTDGILYNQENPGSNLLGGALPVKYGEDPEATGEASQVDWIVYRYADVITLLSEAIVRNKGVTQEAVDLLNMIRERARLKPYALSDIKDTNDMLDKILLERGKEFFFEGVRRSDLIRHGKYIEYARKYKNSITAADYMVLMPLPQSIINEGKGLIIQNPGY